MNNNNASEQSKNHGEPPVQKIYLGNARRKERRNGDQFLVGSICLDDIDNIPEEHIQNGSNGKRYVNIIINPFREGTNQHGNTHSIALDTFKPDPNYNNTNRKT